MSAAGSMGRRSPEDLMVSSSSSRLQSSFPNQLLDRLPDGRPADPECPAKLRFARQFVFPTARCESLAEKFHYLIEDRRAIDGVTHGASDGAGVVRRKYKIGSRPGSCGFGCGLPACPTCSTRGNFRLRRGFAESSVGTFRRGAMVAIETWSRSGPCGGFPAWCPARSGKSVTNRFPSSRDGEPRAVPAGIFRDGLLDRSISCQREPKKTLPSTKR